MRDRSADVIGLLAPRPEPSEQRWDQAESEIGARLPADYKTLVDGLGGDGAFDDCLCIPEPADLGRLAAERDAVWEFVRSRSYRKVLGKYFVEGIRLIPFAVFEQNHFYWIAVASTPEDEWRVLFVDADMEDWLEFDMSATGCIFQLLNRRIRHLVFDEYFVDPPFEYVTWRTL